MTPLIGITADLDLGTSAQSIAPGRHYYLLTQNYCDAVTKSGAVPVIVPCVSPEQCDEVLERCDGLVLSGGVDIDPSYYNEEPDVHLGPINPERAAFETSITVKALERDMPVLAICGGGQILNVVRGGSLYQDINTQIPDVINHRQLGPRNYPFHSVEIRAKTKLHSIIKASKIRVNSRHHQAVKELGKDLIAAAVASDGVVEAVESTAHTFVIGVQWHPEIMFDHDAHTRALFSAFVKACGK